MIEKLNKNLTQFYQISLVAIMTAALGAVFYFWKLGFIDGSRSKDLHKAGFTLEEMTEGKGLKNIKSFVYREDPKLALEAIEGLESEMKDIHSLVEDSSYEKAFTKLQELKSEVGGLISFPKSPEVLSVFNSKMEKFSDYVKRNNWRTLTRMSERVLGASKDPMGPGELDRLVKSVEKDFSSMVRITENSVLSRAEKSEIISRIEGLKTETGMLSKYLGKRKTVFKKMSSFGKAYQGWLEKTAPEISLQKLQVERMGRYYVMGMLGVLGLTGLLFFAGFAFNRYARNRSGAVLEEKLKTLIGEGIINGKDFLEGEFSQDFERFVRTNSQYVNKRMSFGSIFQDALPLSAVMLDKNLKVEWTNKQFCDDWVITEEEASQDYMSWDYLAKLTNLGHDDPVVEALKNDVAGIYQIQVKPNEDIETRPYEMFVAPVKNQGQKKIMLFFYPLLSMRETIQDQAVSIVNPIDKTLRLFMDDAFSTSDKKQLRKEYEVGGIEGMLDMFEKFYEKKESEKAQLINKIEMLYSDLERAHASADEAYDLNSQMFSASKEQVHDLKTFKEGVISLSDTARKLEEFSLNFNKQFGETLKDLDGFQNDFGSLKNAIEDMAVGLPNLDSIKDEIKAQRAQTGESKARLGQALAGLIHIKKGISHPEIVRKFQNSYDMANERFNDFDAAHNGLEKRLVQLEVAVSKAQLLINSAYKNSEGLSSSQDFNALKAKKESRLLLRERAEELQGRSAQSEEIIISSLQSIYKGHKENLKRQAQIAKHLELQDIHAGLQASGHTGTTETTM